MELYLPQARSYPAGWQTAIQQRLSYIRPKTLDHSVVTHPALDYEIEDMMRKHVGLKVALYAVILLLLLGNTFLVTKVWRFLRLTCEEIVHGDSIELLRKRGISVDCRCE